MEVDNTPVFEGAHAGVVNSLLEEGLEVESVLGEGGFGVVFKCVEKMTQASKAVKLYYKKSSRSMAHAREVQRLRFEVEVLRELDHPNIVQLHNFFEKELYMALVLEYVPSGDLFELIVREGSLGEDLARRLFKQIVIATDYCHSLNIIHRDIKPMNILIDSNVNIKLTDFGLSCRVKPGRLIDEAVGSLDYAAPEVLCEQPYEGPEVDVWSMGVTLYSMVCGFLPFRGDTDAEIFQKIVAADFFFPAFLSEDICFLLDQMLDPDGDERATLQEVKESLWYNADPGTAKLNTSKGTITVGTPVTNLLLETMSPMPRVVDPSTLSSSAPQTDHIPGTWVSGSPVRHGRGRRLSFSCSVMESKSKLVRHGGVRPRRKSTLVDQLNPLEVYHSVRRRSIAPCPEDIPASIKFARKQSFPSKPGSWIKQESLVSSSGSVERTTSPLAKFSMTASREDIHELLFGEDFLADNAFGICTGGTSPPPVSSTLIITKEQVKKSQVRSKSPGVNETSPRDQPKVKTPEVEEGDMLKTSGDKNNQKGSKRRKALQRLETKLRTAGKPKNSEGSTEVSSLEPSSEESANSSPAVSPLCSPQSSPTMRNKYGSLRGRLFRKSKKKNNKLGESR